MIRILLTVLILIAFMATAYSRFGPGGWNALKSGAEETVADATSGVLSGGMEKPAE